MDQQQLIQALRPRLQNFKQISKEKFSFRCPVCGDGKNGHDKARNGFIKVKDSYVTKCFNCGDSKSLLNFAKWFDYDLYKKFRYDSFKGIEEETFNNTQPEITEEKSTDDLFAGLARIVDLPSTHDAVQYLNSRKIPKSKQTDLFFTDDFNRYAKKYTDKIESDRVASAIVIPLVAINGEQFGFQGRYLEDSYLRYKIVQIDSRFTTCYGTHLINLDDDIHVTEGAFDSMFFKNGMAALNSGLHQICQRLPIDNDKFVLWYDNEPSNQQVMQLKSKAIESGFRVAFYHSDVKASGKDINEMLLSDFTRENYKRVINDATIASGLKAKMLHGKETGGRK